MMPPNERVLFLRWGVRSGYSGYGILLVTTGRVVFRDTTSGASIRISDITEHSGGRGMSWPESRNSYLDIQGYGGKHNFYFEGDKTSAVSGLSGHREGQDVRVTSAPAPLAQLARQLIYGFEG